MEPPGPPGGPLCTRAHVEDLLRLLRLRPEEEHRLLALPFPVPFAELVTAFESLGITRDELTDREGGSP